MLLNFDVDEANVSGVRAWDKRYTRRSSVA
jgi:hypothetical protein